MYSSGSIALLLHQNFQQRDPQVLHPHPHHLGYLVRHSLRRLHLGLQDLIQQYHS